MPANFERTANKAKGRLALAGKLFREFYASCFWHLRPDLDVSEEMIPVIVHGLRAPGGRRGMLAATQLLDTEATSA